MRFLIPINEVEDEGSQTVQIVDTGTDNKRKNKTILMSYFYQIGVPRNQIKRVMKAMGFWGDNLGKPNIFTNDDSIKLLGSNTPS